MWRYNTGIYNVGDVVRIRISNKYETHSRRITITDVARHGCQVVYTGKCMNIEYLLITVDGILNKVLYYPTSGWILLVEIIPSTNMIMYRE